MWRRIGCCKEVLSLQSTNSASLHTMYRTNRSQIPQSMHVWWGVLMSHSRCSCISPKTYGSTIWRGSTSLYVPTFVGLCHRCWSSNVPVSLTELCEVLCNKCFGNNSRWVLKFPRSFLGFRLLFWLQ